MFRKILVAIDDSAHQKTVFAGALTLAKKINAQLLLLHVLSPDEPVINNPALPTVFSGYYPTVSEELIKRFQAEQRALENRGLEMLRSLASEAIAIGVTTEFTQNMGDPGGLICAIAKNWGADLIAIGRRGHSGLSELFLGSVSNYVLHHAPCSVLAIQNRAEVKLKASSEHETAAH